MFSVENPQRGKTSGPSPKLIHYQFKSNTPKFYSKQVRVLWSFEEYDVSSKKLNSTRGTKSTKTHNTWLMTEAAMSRCLSVLVYLRMIEGINQRKRVWAL